MESDTFTLSPTWFSCNKLFKQVIQLCSAQAAKKQQQLVSVSDISDTNKQICADRERLKQVLCNLLDNAIKFTPTGGHITLFVNTIHDPNSTSENEIINVKVQDTGIGIAAEALNHIFEPFCQAEANTSRRFGGTGLGLTICRQLVRQMGGDLQVTSQPGQGSTFSFSISFPIRYVQALSDDVKKDDVQITIDESITTPTQPKFRVLLVEDNIINQKVAVRMIRNQGHDVMIACDGKDAIEKFTTHPNEFDVVLMDIHMPVMDGYAATSEIRRYEQQRGCSRVPIIAVTACASEDDRQNIKAVGMDDVLTKPITLNALLDMFRVLSR